MNPALMDYLRSQQPAQSNNNAQPSTPYNPFDDGIRRAIDTARASIGMTNAQQDQALRKSMLTFANAIGQQPREKGFWNNFRSIGNALSPAVTAYDNEENRALNENNALANQILAYQAAERDRVAQDEQRQWQRDFAEKQLGESARGHNLLERFRRDQLEETKRYHDLQSDFKQNELTLKKDLAGKKTDKKHTGEVGDLDKVLDYANKTINKIGEKGERGRVARVADTFTPGGIQPTQEQAEVDALGKTLKGILFNAWGYRAQAEFKELPTISSNNSLEANKANLKQLINITKLKMGEATPDQLVGNQKNQQQSQNEALSNEGYIRLMDPETQEIQEVLLEDVPLGLQNGLIEVK